MTDYSFDYDIGDAAIVKRVHIEGEITGLHVSRDGVTSYEVRYPRTDGGFVNDWFRDDEITAP